MRALVGAVFGLIGGILITNAYHSDKEHKKQLEKGRKNNS